VVDQLLFLVHREDDDARANFFAVKFARHFKTGQTRQVHVEHGHVGLFFEDEFQRRFAITASPTSSKRESASITCRKPLRNSGWSSTIKNLGAS